MLVNERRISVYVSVNELSFVKKCLFINFAKALITIMCKGLDLFISNFVSLKILSKCHKDSQLFSRNNEIP